MKGSGLACVREKRRDPSEKSEFAFVMKCENTTEPEAVRGGVNFELFTLAAALTF